MKKIVSLVGAALVLAAVPMSADATPTVTVHLDVDLAFRTVAVGDCDVTVDAGSDGVAVLDQAVVDGCIDSYKSEHFPGFGAFVTCINDICQTPDETLNAVFWMVYLDGEASDVGISKMSFSEAGHVLGFSYEPWAPCFVGGVCP